mmetsp:Transcript_10476/g.23137  ORF Transcript_10476/g.23137 Transcript_10476/m.23137 type:complete len:219 (-) Transcript_10476:480-1136(-)
MRSIAKLILAITAIPEIYSISSIYRKPFAPDPATSSLKQDLYRLCEGTRNGVDADDQTRSEIARVVRELETMQPAEIVPTELPLKGSRHKLLYCESKGGSSGKIGPFVGVVEQLFATDDTNFTNCVTLGPFRISLAAEKKVIDDRRIKVTFRETTATAFGIELLKKPTKGSGVWTQRFVDDDIRIMDTPSLFIIRREQDSTPTLVDVLNNPAGYIAEE